MSTMPRKVRNPEQQLWLAEPPIDTGARAEHRPPTADPEAWGTTADGARELLEAQICPICRSGPWRSVLNHVARKHGINRLDMRDVCGLSMKTKVTDADTRAKYEANGAKRADHMATLAAGMKGRPRDVPQRRTRRFTEALRPENNGLVRWAAEHPEDAAALRSTMQERVNTPEAKERWALAMVAVRADRVWTDEERRAFTERMASPDVVAKRNAQRVRGTCSVPGCDRPHAAIGFCHMHWTRAAAWGGDPGPAERLTPEYRSDCAVEGCPRPHAARGLCRMHYDRAVITGDPGPVARIKPESRDDCSVEGCDRRHKAHGYCRTHWARVKKNGEPGSVDPEDGKT